MRYTVYIIKLYNMIDIRFSEWGLTTDVAEKPDCTVAFENYGM